MLRIMENLRTERLQICKPTLNDVDAWMEYFNLPLDLQFYALRASQQ